MSTEPRPFISRSLLKPTQPLIEPEHKEAVKSLYTRFQQHDLLGALPADQEYIEETVIESLREQALFDLDSMHPQRTSKAKKEVIDHTLYHLLLFDKPAI